jgi:hypothetical protein
MANGPGSCLACSFWIKLDSENDRVGELRGDSSADRAAPTTEINYQKPAVLVPARNPKFRKNEGNVFRVRLVKVQG